MWENAVPNTPPQPAYSKRRSEQSHRADGDFVLWGQFLLSLFVVTIVLAARVLEWPVLPAWRLAFEQAMRPEQQLFLSEERSFSRFTELAVQTLESTTQKVRQQLTNVASGESALRGVHQKSQLVPSGAREEMYLPKFSLTFPLKNASVIKTSGYGWRADPMGGSGSDFHLGNDLAAMEGTAVLAAADGVVRCAGVHNSYGNYIRILHANGDETLYAHLQYLFVHTGQRVSAGSCLGTVGETGNATGPHLHFEILHKGIRYDPTEALQSAS